MLNVIYIMEHENTILFDKLNYTNDEIVNIHNIGIYYKKFFNDDIDYFSSIINEHKFQTLTESNKISNAFRKGIYITNVEKCDNDDLKFNLLRCSSNLDGPTDNFRNIDLKIINKVSDTIKPYFDKPFNLNHVLAQVYENDIEKSKKAKIKKHSDKTKDMEKSGIMVFCSFYNNEELKKCAKSLTDEYDYVYKKTSVLTKLKFELKNDVKNDNLVKKFEITLYPNSIFVMPLSTNRLYTHEICPSTLEIKQIPTRLGYVIRCSKTSAIYKNDKTFIINKENNNLVELIEPIGTEITRLKDLYYNENVYSNMVEYNGFNFSLNKGDYTKPLL